jgi:hypothetical protein
MLLEKAIAVSQGVEHDDLSVQRRVAYALSGLDAHAPNEAAGRGIKVHDGRAVALTSLARALGSVGDVEQAARVADSIPDPSARRDASGQISQALADAGSVQAAIHVIERVDDLDGSGAWTRAMAIKAVATACRSGPPTGDLRYLAGLASGIKDEPARLQAYVAVGLAMVERSDRDGLKQITAEVERLEHPNTRAEGLAAMANLMARIGIHEMPIQMLTEAQAIEDEWARAEAIAGVSQALAVLNQRNHIAAALEALEGIKKDGARAHALNGVIQGFVRAGDVQGVHRAFTFLRGFEDEFSQAEVVGGPRVGLSYGATDIIHTLYDYEQSRFGMARAFAQLGSGDGISKCLAVATSLQVERHRSDALVGVLLALAMYSPDDAFNQFRAFADHIDDSGIAELLVGIAGSYAESGDLNALDRVLSEGRLIGDPSARATVISEVARLFAEGDQVEGVRRACGIVEQSFTSEAAKADAIVGLAKAAAQVKDESVLRRALKCAPSVWYEPPRACALGGVVCAAMRAGATEIATDGLAQTLALLRETSGGSGEVRRGVVEAVADMLLQLSDAADPAILLQVVRSLRELGSEFHRIRGYLEQGRSGILAATASAVAATHDLQALEELRTIAESLPGCDEYSCASTGVATALARLSMSEHALAALAGVFLRIGRESRADAFEALWRTVRWLAEQRERELLGEVASGVLQTESWLS